MVRDAYKIINEDSLKKWPYIGTRLTLVSIGIVANIFAFWIISKARPAKSLNSLRWKNFRNANYYLKVMCCINTIILTVSIIPVLQLRDNVDLRYCKLNLIMVKVYMLFDMALKYTSYATKGCLIWDRYMCVKEPQSMVFIRNHLAYKLIIYVFFLLFIIIFSPTIKVFHILYDFVYTDPSLLLSFRVPRCTATYKMINRNLFNYFIGRSIVIVVVILIVIFTLAIKMINFLRCSNVRVESMNVPSLMADNLDKKMQPKYNSANESRLFQKPASKVLNCFHIGVVGVMASGLPHNMILDKFNLLKVDRANVIADKWRSSIKKIYVLLAITLCYILAMSIRAMYNTYFMIKCGLKVTGCPYGSSFEAALSLLEIFESVIVFGFILLDKNLTKSLKKICKSILCCQNI